MYPSHLSTSKPYAGCKTLTTAVASLIAAVSIFLMLVITAISPASAEDGARFLRMGLNKSVAIRLPVAAKDVLVGNPEVVDAVIRTRTTAYLFAKKNGQTNLFFFDDAGRQILNLDIEVAADVKALKQLLDRTLPDNQITIDTVADNIILRGVAKSSGEAKQALDLAQMFVAGSGQGDSNKVVSALNIAAREQVTLRVRIAEVKRDVLKQLGVDYNAAFAQGSFAAGMVTGNPFSLNGPLAGNTLFPTNPLSGLSGGGTGNTGARLQYGDNIDSFIQAMERDGLLRTLAEPTLTAISGESAKFLAGGEFPIVTAIDSNTGTRTVEFKEFGVGLGFSPVVLSEGRISLKINTEVSEPDGSAGVPGITGLKTRKAETTVELPSGGSMIMAGMIQEDTRQAINGIPGAKNLPVLGQLFRSNDFQQSQTELTVMVTPYIIKPVNERELVSPIDKLSVATDRQSYLFGRLNKVYGTQGGVTKGGSTYHGNVGFIVE
jgi:pilus assembly protein CpaC